MFGWQVLGVWVWDRKLSFITFNVKMEKKNPVMCVKHLFYSFFFVGL